MQLKKPDEIPNKPGVYKFLDKDNKVLYVGKAKNLYNRLKNYFQIDQTKLHGITNFMMQYAKKVEWTIVNSEIEALSLEWEQIKKYKPKYNIIFKDDKSYPYILVSNETPLRIFTSRNQNYKKYKYYGPYLSVKMLNDVLELLIKLNPARTCPDSIYKNAKSKKRPCLKYNLNLCLAPCVHKGTKNDENIKNIIKEISNPKRKLINFLERKMLTLSNNKEFENAGKIRDVLFGLKKISEKNSVIFPKNTEFDLFAFAENDSIVVCKIFSVKNGLIDFEKSVVIEKLIDYSKMEILEKVLLEFYSNTIPPSEILAQYIPENVVISTLNKSRSVNFKIPKSGNKKTLLDTAIINAKEKLKIEEQKKLSGKKNIGIVLSKIKDDLNMKEYPLRIEAFDIAHMQGKYTVGSMVVFEDGIPNKNQYRRFEIKSPKNNDVMSLLEVLKRRFSEKNMKDEKFSYKPNLIMIDGGKAQFNIGKKIIDDLKIKNVAVISMAKRQREVFFKDGAEPYSPKGSVLYFFEKISNEAHRFAISYYRKKHQKNIYS